MKKLLSTKFGWRLSLMWPFGETNVAAMDTTRLGSTSIHRSRASFAVPNVGPCAMNRTRARRLLRLQPVFLGRLEGRAQEQILE
jgi:hypothetical protein